MVKVDDLIDLLERFRGYDLDIDITAKSHNKLL